MRYGILGDIHANLEALTAVLDACKDESVDRYLCAGDIVGYAANPADCITTIKELAAVAVAGNHDRATAGLLGVDYFNYEARQAISWTKEKLDSGEQDFLAALELVYRNDDLTLVHGTLDAPQDFNYMLDTHSSRNSFELLDHKICFIGHTHVPAIFAQDQNKRILCINADSISLEEDNKYIVNAGSVGQPRDNDPRACYCIYDTAKKKVMIKRVGYDIGAARRKIIESGLPRFLGERLLRGL